METLQWISAMAGGLLSLATVGELVRGTYGFYVDFYLMPEEKYGVLTPPRWQDVVFLIAFYLVSATLLYVSYRLLRYAFRHGSSVTV
ncbi:MAG: hypothetical protein ACRD8A_14435 [Candidatus Acidiferrales bacterium]